MIQVTNQQLQFSSIQSLHKKKDFHTHHNSTNKIITNYSAKMSSRTDLHSIDICQSLHHYFWHPSHQKQKQVWNAFTTGGYYGISQSEDKCVENIQSIALIMQAAKHIADTPYSAGWDNIDHLFQLLVFIIQGSIETLFHKLCYNLLNKPLMNQIQLIRGNSKSMNMTTCVPQLPSI